MTELYTVEKKQHIPQKLYNEIIGNVPIACVDIAIIANGSVLLVKRKDPPAKDMWWLPGGRVLKGEMMKETALRKAREEVGIECHAGPIIYTAETIFPDGPYDIPIHSINSCFFLYPVSAEQIPSLDDHHEDYRWVNCIDNSYHQYVQRCLMAAGFEMKSVSEKK
ncbi:GDP-mannose mannosyl hydrolase [Chitinispirillum alkaliphilum]|nr:GDP-mannose mannosyl hydrolase [Chitinispirillum alkaliphilum]